MKWAWWILLFFQPALGQDDPLKDDKGQKILRNDIAGNPFLLKDWASGVIRFKSGRAMDQFKLKFDCAQNMLLLQFQGSAFAAESKVQSFTIYPEKKRKDSLSFRKGFPATTKANTETFYQVLLEGKTVLLKLFVKNILEEQQIGMDAVRRRYTDDEEYYLLKDGQMILLPQEREPLLQALVEKSAELRQYIADQQLRLRSNDDFVKIITRYNELLE